MRKLLPLLILASFTAMANVHVININAIDKDGFQIIKFVNIENTCYYYGEIKNIKTDQKVIMVTHRVCGNIDSKVNLFVQSNSKINLDSQWIPAGLKWTLQ